MAAARPSILFVSSTAGSVMNRVLETKTVRDAVHSVVAPEDCPALGKARTHGLKASILPAGSNAEFCANLLDYVEENQISYILSFYTQFYTDDIRAAMRDRIVNFHPSLLPAFKGMDGFGEGIAYHTKIIGTTVELIKDVMDEGKIVMQTACAVDPALSLQQMRHRIFLQQCKTLVQVVDWIAKDRISVAGDKVRVTGARFDGAEFSPALENAEAIALSDTPHAARPRSTASA